MRLLLCAAASALVIAACSRPTEPASDANAAAEEAAPAAEMAEMDHSDMDHDMGEMDGDMAAMDAADDVNTEETPDGFTFHTYPDRVESIHLPVVEGETWTASIDQPSLVSLADGSQETMPDGSVHYVIPANTLASGNAVVTMQSAPEGGEASQTRTIHFMIH